MSITTTCGRIGRFAPFLPFLGNTCLFGCLHSRSSAGTDALIAVDKYPGVPRIYLQEVEAGRPFYVRETEILPVTVMRERLLSWDTVSAGGWGM